MSFLEWILKLDGFGQFLVWGFICFVFFTCACLISEIIIRIENIIISWIENRSLKTDIRKILDEEEPTEDKTDDRTSN